MIRGCGDRGRKDGSWQRWCENLGQKLEEFVVINPHGDTLDNAGKIQTVPNKLKFTLKHISAHQPHINTSYQHIISTHIKAQHIASTPQHTTQRTQHNTTQYRWLRWVFEHASHKAHSLAARLGIAGQKAHALRQHAEGH